MLVTSVMQAVQFKMNVLTDLTVQVQRQQHCKHVLLVNIVDKVVMVTVLTVVQVTSVGKELRAKECAHPVHTLLTTMAKTTVHVNHAMAPVDIAHRSFYHRGSSQMEIMPLLAILLEQFTQEKQFVLLDHFVKMVFPLNVILLMVTFLLLKVLRNAPPVAMVSHVPVQQVEKIVQKAPIAKTMLLKHVERAPLDRLSDRPIVTCVIYVHQVSYVLLEG